MGSPPAAVTFVFKRFSGGQLTRFHNHAGAADVTSVLMLSNPSRNVLPLIRCMLKRGDPAIPNVWNHGAGLSPTMVGVLFPIAPHALITTEVMLLQYCHNGLVATGVNPGEIQLSIEDSPLPSLVLSHVVAKAMLVQHLIIEPDPPLPDEPITEPPPACFQVPATNLPPAASDPLTPVRASSATVNTTTPGSSVSAVLSPDAVTRREHDALAYQVKDMGTKLDTLITILTPRVTPQLHATEPDPVVGASLGNDGEGRNFITSLVGVERGTCAVFAKHRCALGGTERSVSLLCNICT